MGFCMCLSPRVVYVRAFVFVYVCVCVCVCAFACICVFLYLSVFVYVGVFVCVCFCMCMYVCVYSTRIFIHCKEYFNCHCDNETTTKTRAITTKIITIALTVTKPVLITTNTITRTMISVVPKKMA